ncbi:MAG: diaminopimelate decarboxylase [Methanomassiliicoccaceae archaeon]|jgi:diaminopimelate decarboxylase|nr:diaminopimelate decarboxylase [Methanomassiliicoccaceae archaeon]
MRDFKNDDGHMIFGGMRAADIADKFGTPVYVTDENILRENYRRIYGVFSKHMPTRVHYACKANSSLAVLKILEQEGSHIDAVSIGEVLTCMKAGFPASRILYTGTCVSTPELKAVADLGVMINIDSVSELERLAKINPNIPISIRVTPGIGSGHSDKVVTGAKGSKFGIPIDLAMGTFRRAMELGLKVKGIHAHIGSGGKGIGPLIDAVAVLIDLTNQIRDELEIELEFINMGGGIGVPYRPNEPEEDLEELAATVTDMILNDTSVGILALEPGRYVVCDSTVLLTRCVDVKKSGVKNYVCVDAGFNTLIRPAFYDSYHHVAIANKFNKAGTGKYDVVGPICESGDFLAKDRALPAPEDGDIVAVYNCGAYSFAMSSTYNSRPRCREVLVKDGKAELIRGSETMDDLWRHQTIPERLLK